MIPLYCNTTSGFHYVHWLTNGRRFLCVCVWREERGRFEEGEGTAFGDHNAMLHVINMVHGHFVCPSAIGLRFQYKPLIRLLMHLLCKKQLIDRNCGQQE